MNKSSHVVTLILWHSERTMLHELPVHPLLHNSFTAEITNNLHNVSPLSVIDPSHSLLKI